MYKDLKVLSIIPARGGSKGVPGKNIKMLAGKPLIAWSIDASKESKHIDRTIVSTDGEDIAKVAKEWGAEVPFMRPAEFAQDLTPDPPVFEHALAWLKENENYVPDIVVHLRPTGPLRTPEEIDESIELLAKYPESDSVRSLQEPAKPPYKMWKQSDGDFIIPFVSDMPGMKDWHTAPRQSLPKVFETTADIGVMWARTILEKKSVIGDKVLPYFLKRPTVDIDNLADFEIAELLFAKKEVKKV
jgi:CMP-N,N'-diacetyllegionaminic acid synthase